MAVTGSCPFGLQKPSILQSPLSMWYDALVSAALSPTSGHMIHLPASTIGWGLLGTSSLVPSATSDLLTSPQSVVKPVTATPSPPTHTLYSKGVGPGCGGGSQIRRDETFLDKRQWCQAPVFPTSTLMKSHLTGRPRPTLIHCNSLL